MIAVLLLAIPVGICIGVVGIGGVLLPPALSWLTGLDIHAAAGTSSWCFLFTGLAGTAAYARSRAMPWRFGAHLTLGAAPAAAAGAWVNGTVPATALWLLLATLTAGSGAFNLWGRPRGRRDAAGGALTQAPPAEPRQADRAPPAEADSPRRARPAEPSPPPPEPDPPTHPRPAEPGPPAESRPQPPETGPLTQPRRAEPNPPPEAPPAESGPPAKAAPPQEPGPPRQAPPAEPGSPPGRRHELPPAGAVAVGAFVGFGSALTGTGGPVLLVPVLLALGVPVLTTVAAGQLVQLPLVGFATLGYTAHGSVHFGLGSVLGVLSAAGVLLGARLARRLPARHLHRVVSAALVGFGGLLFVLPFLPR
ncbi:TSUP family transporter [Amycolatopsis sp. cg9]|uniref:TSUP family transporter n=1 Tax=Amycolatopsis sp. cg9 TaxID=3238801 RepID=UPI003525945F